jgi:hypothetical protein
MPRTGSRCALETRRCAGILVLAALSPVAATAVPAPTAPSESTLASLPPIRLLVAPDGRFVTSQLVLDHGRDETPFLTGVIVPQLDLAELDAHGRFPDGDVPADSTKRLFRHRPPQDAAALSPEEKKAAVPPEPGVHAGIPSAVAVTGTLLGGLALLVKILTGFF